MSPLPRDNLSPSVGGSGEAHVAPSSPAPALAGTPSIRRVAFLETVLLGPLLSWMVGDLIFGLVVNRDRGGVARGAVRLGGELQWRQEAEEVLT